MKITSIKRMTEDTLAASKGYLKIGISFKEVYLVEYEEETKSGLTAKGYREVYKGDEIFDSLNNYIQEFTEVFEKSLGIE